MFPVALDCGIPATVYWDLTLMEITDIVESHRRKTERAKKDRVSEMFICAEATANRIGYIFTDSKSRSESDLLWPWDLFPDLFSEEAEEQEKRAAEAETAAIKAIMDARARAVNDKFGGNE